MGGFAIKGTEPGSWRNVKLEDVVAGKIFIPFLEEVEIANGSKSDAVAKTIVIIQLTWFISQLCSRVNQGLVITELEIMTLAYAVICAMLYGMWFWKPYDVQRPIMLEGPQESVTTYAHAPITGMDVLAGTYLWIAQGHVVDDPFFADVKLHSFPTFISATIFGAIHLLACAYSSEFPTRWEYTLWVLASICVSVAPFVFGWLLFKAFRAAHYFLSLPFSTYTIPLLYNAYFVARIFLVVESFALLRDLSPSAMRTVPWSSYFPHI